MQGRHCRVVTMQGSTKAEHKKANVEKQQNNSVKNLPKWNHVISKEGARQKW